MVSIPCRFYYRIPLYLSESIDIAYTILSIDIPMNPPAIFTVPRHGAPVVRNSLPAPWPPLPEPGSVGLFGL